jgi:hypothetical protein
MENFIVEKEFKHAKVLTVTNSPNTAIIEALTNYIPLEPFKEIFNFVGELAKEKKITKLIFDKRKLTVFHQPSMEWYFVEWKEKMFDQGLNIHRKILPVDDVFRQSVRIGREKIDKNYPTKKFNQMDIQYAETIEEALLK